MFLRNRDESIDQLSEMIRPELLRKAITQGYSDVSLSVMADFKPAYAEMIIKSSYKPETINKLTNAYMEDKLSMDDMFRVIDYTEHTTRNEPYVDAFLESVGNSVYHETAAKAFATVNFEKCSYNTAIDYIKSEAFYPTDFSSLSVTDNVAGELHSMGVPLRACEGFNYCYDVTNLNEALGNGAAIFVADKELAVKVSEMMKLPDWEQFRDEVRYIMGQNIGTCVTALISSVGAKKNAKRASMIHLYFNMIGTVIFMVIFYSLNMFVHFEFLSTPANAAGIAVIHSLFNIGCVIILFPFSNLLVKLATLSIPDGKHEEVIQTGVAADLAALDERFLETPAVAMELCRNTAVKMAHLSQKALDKALDIINNYSDAAYDEVVAMEEDVDKYEDKLGSYLVKVGNCDLSRHDNHTFSILLHCMSDFERISDHAINIAKSAKEMNSRESSFSQNARKELETFAKAVHDIVGNTVQVFENQDIEAAKHIEPLEQVIDGLNLEIKQRHINRLRKGRCTIETGLILEDIMTNFERVSDHCSNIAVCMIEVRDNGFETHGYLEHLTNEDNPQFAKECRDYYKQYQLPELKKAD